MAIWYILFKILSWTFAVACHYAYHKSKFAWTVLVCAFCLVWIAHPPLSALPWNRCSVCCGLAGGCGSVRGCKPGCSLFISLGRKWCCLVWGKKKFLGKFFPRLWSFPSWVVELWPWVPGCWPRSSYTSFIWRGQKKAGGGGMKKGGRQMNTCVKKSQE